MARIRTRAGRADTLEIIRHARLVRARAFRRAMHRLTVGILGHVRTR